MVRTKLENSRIQEFKTLKFLEFIKKCLWRALYSKFGHFLKLKKFWKNWTFCKLILFVFFKLRPYACIMTSRGLMPARNANRPRKLNNSKWPLSKFPGRWLLLRPAFFAGINPCDVIMHKVYWRPKLFQIH
jgi:hypothetical protein